MNKKMNFETPDLSVFVTPTDLGLSATNDLLVATQGTVFEGKEKNCWYWYTDPREGDIWYPCYLMDNGEVMIDGHKRHANLCNGVAVIKAVMPE